MQEYMEMFQRVQLEDQIMFEILAEMSGVSDQKYRVW